MISVADEYHALRAAARRWWRLTRAVFALTLGAWAAEIWTTDPRILDTAVLITAACLVLMLTASSYAARADKLQKDAVGRLHDRPLRGER